LRPFGRTTESVTLIGLGGYHSASPEKEADSIALIQRAVDEGITFLDNAWDYLDGKAEERMGKALAQGGRRDKVFLMTKCCGRDAKTAQSNLEDSLRRLRTDHLDLWQFHEIIYDNDPDWIFGRDGAIETALKAKEQGKIRHLGFTGHKDPAIHLKMLTKPYDWASVQMPLNVMDGQFRSFQQMVLPQLVQRGIAPIGMKSLGGTGKIVSEAGVPIEDALRYVFSLPIATLISGIDSMKVLEQNLKIVREFKPMTAAEMVAVNQRVGPLAGDGRYELFKTSKLFDGTVHRKQHGFSTSIG
jgi:predicted aldo/keto reductase-like oxidoreductase